MPKRRAVELYLRLYFLGGGWLFNSRLPIRKSGCPI
jgi:hypothetical protein